MTCTDCNILSQWTEGVLVSYGVRFCQAHEQKVNAFDENQKEIERLRQLIIDSQRPHGTCYWGLGFGFSSGMEEACTACAAKRSMKTIADEAAALAEGNQQ